MLLRTDWAYLLEYVINHLIEISENKTSEARRKANKVALGQEESPESILESSKPLCSTRIERRWFLVSNSYGDISYDSRSCYSIVIPVW
jgi:hypothetical protein